MWYRTKYYSERIRVPSVRLLVQRVPWKLHLTVSVETIRMWFRSPNNYVVHIGVWMLHVSWSGKMRLLHKIVKLMPKWIRSYNIRQELYTTVHVRICKPTSDSASNICECMCVCVCIIWASHSHGWLCKCIYVRATTAILILHIELCTIPVHTHSHIHCDI